jgi:hypothetical protein
MRCIDTHQHISKLQQHALVMYVSGDITPTKSHELVEMEEEKLKCKNICV